MSLDETMTFLLCLRRLEVSLPVEYKQHICGYLPIYYNKKWKEGNLYSEKIFYKFIERPYNSKLRHSRNITEASFTYKSSMKKRSQKKLLFWTTYVDGKRQSVDGFPCSIDFRKQAYTYNGFTWFSFVTGWKILLTRSTEVPILITKFFERIKKWEKVNPKIKRKHLFTAGPKKKQKLTEIFIIEKK